MGRINSIRYIDFRIVDLSNLPVSTRVLTDFQIFFTRNEIPCSDVLNLVNLNALAGGPGRYAVSYIPSAQGHDFLEIYDPLYDIRIQDAEDIDSIESFFGTLVPTLTQDTGGVGRLKLTVANPETYTLYVFRSQDWQSGLTAPLNAVNFTTLDAGGNWVTHSLSVLPDVYHIVAMNQTGTVIVLAAFLDLSSGSTTSSSSGGSGSPGSSSGTLLAHAFSPSPDGGTTTFTLSVDPTGRTALVFLNGILLSSPGDYSLTGTSLSLTFAPASTDILVVYF